MNVNDTAGIDPPIVAATPSFGFPFAPESKLPHLGDLLQKRFQRAYWRGVVDEHIALYASLVRSMPRSAL